MVDPRVALHGPKYGGEFHSQARLHGDSSQVRCIKHQGLQHACFDSASYNDPSRLIAASSELQSILLVKTDMDLVQGLQEWPQHNPYTESHDYPKDGSTRR